MAIPDRISFPALIQEADEAVAQGREISYANDHHARACGQPDRLLLPKGTKQGMDFHFDVYITSGSDSVHDSVQDGNHAYCGMHGQKYPDKKPMGFPYDRNVPDRRLFDGLKNIHTQQVKIFFDEDH